MNRLKIIVNYVIVVLQYIIVSTLLLESIFFSGYFAYLFHQFVKNSEGNNDVILFPFIFYWIFYFFPYSSVSILNLCYIGQFVKMKFKNFGVAFNNCFRFLDLILTPYIAGRCYEYLTIISYNHIIAYKAAILMSTVLLQPVLIGVYYLLNNNSNRISASNNTNIINDSISVSDVSSITVNIA